MMLMCREYFGEQIAFYFAWLGENRIVTALRYLVFDLSFVVSLDLYMFLSLVAFHNFHIYI